MPFERVLNSGGNACRKPSTMDTKMDCITSLLGTGTQNCVKWRTNRGVISCRPPPGGPQAVSRVMSSMSFQNSFFRS